MYILFYYFFDWLEILPIDKEEDNEITRNSVRSELDLDDKSCIDYLNDLLKKFDFEKHKQIQKMSAEEMVTFDDNLGHHYELSNEEIYDLATEKEIEELEEEKIESKPVVAFNEALKSWSLLKDFIEQTDDFSEKEFNAISVLNTKFESLGEKKYQQKISNFFNK